jgi:hypothetical protein
MISSVMDYVIKDKLHHIRAISQTAFLTKACNGPIEARSPRLSGERWHQTTSALHSLKSGVIYIKMLICGTFNMQILVATLFSY